MFLLKTLKKFLKLEQRILLSSAMARIKTRVIILLWIVYWGDWCVRASPVAPIAAASWPPSSSPAVTGTFGC